LNLLAKVLEIANIKEKVVQVAKYFRNNHLAAAAYKITGGLRLVMPQEVWWNTMADCLEIYIKE
jgi:tRNA G37 N-methylase TrmD